MDDLLKKIGSLDPLKKYITEVAAKELTSLSTPCYYPKAKIFFYEILNRLKLNEKEFKDFVKRNNKGTKGEKWLLPNEPGANLLIFCMYLFLNKRDYSTYSSVMIYYMIIHYAKLMYKHLKYCYEDTFKYTLDTLTRTHLFHREKTIPNSLYYLSKAMQNSFTKDIQNWNKERILAFMIESRSRISQSVKSFVGSYLRNRKEGGSIKTQNENPGSGDEANAYQYKVLERGQKAVEDVSRKITTYKLVDKKALEDAKRVSKIKTSIAVLIVNEIINERYFNNIKMLLQLFVKDLNDVNMVCGNDYYLYVKKLMALKRTTAQLYFKAQVSILLEQILENLKLINAYKGYTNQTQFIINSFLAFYITSIFRNNLC